MRSARNLLIIILLIVCITGLQGFARPSAQRLQRPPNSVGNALDALGLLQPESVRSILLLYSGKSLLKAKADEIEATLRKTPEKIDERVTLIGYYAANGRTSMDRLRLRSHVLWMIENHPEHASTAEPGLRD